MMWRMALARSLARLVDSWKLLFDFRLLSAFDSFWQVIHKRNGDLCCQEQWWGEKEKKKKKPMIILKEFIYFSFQFQQAAPAKIHQKYHLLRSARSLQVFKSVFCYGVRLGTKSIITFRIVFFLCEATKGAVAHNCHGTTNFYSRQNKINGKTKETTWSAVGQRLLFASERVRRVTINKRNGDLCC